MNLNKIPEPPKFKKPIPPEPVIIREGLEPKTAKLLFISIILAILGLVGIPIIKGVFNVWFR